MWFKRVSPWVPNVGHISLDQQREPHDHRNPRRKALHTRRDNKSHKHHWHCRAIEVSSTATQPTAIPHVAARSDILIGDLAVVVNGLTKTYGNVHAVADVNLSVQRGSVIGLLGPNGSGKTTLIRMLSTLLRPTSGHAAVGGFDILTQGTQVRRCIGLTGQFSAVDTFLTGRENINMMARLNGMSAKAAADRADELLTSFGLQDAADRQLSTYSGGMSRRLDLALSLTGHPSILFLDEPTTGLDPRSRFAVWKVIESLGAAGATVLLSTQYLEEADRLADRVVILDTGRIVAEGTPTELRQRVGGIVIDLILTDAASRERATQAITSIATGPITRADGDASMRIPVANAEQLANTVRLLDAASIAFTGLALHEPTLDDVFLALTGRSSTKLSKETT
jgi:daunorubicin resistance ABC transporter ATP-binding subunit